MKEHLSELTKLEEELQEAKEIEEADIEGTIDDMMKTKDSKLQ